MGKSNCYHWSSSGKAFFCIQHLLPARKGIPACYLFPIQKRQELIRQVKKYAETNITINALAPAAVRTTLVEAMPEAQVKYMTDKIPNKRCGTLDEAADMECFIVSSKNRFSTGFTFNLSGRKATY